MATNLNLGQTQGSVGSLDTPAAGAGSDTVAGAPATDIVTQDQVDEVIPNEAGTRDATLEAARQGVNESTEGKTFTCHPIQNLQIGRFHFKDSTLTLVDPADIESFESVLAGMPLIDRNAIQTVDKAAAEKLAAAFLRDKASKSFDSSVGRLEMEQAQREFPKTGTENLGNTGEAN